MEATRTTQAIPIQRWGGGTGNEASNTQSTVGGGLTNTASGINATVGGGSSNTAGAIGSTVPGGDGNKALGFYSFAAGREAKAAHNNSFVWNDNSDSDTLTTSAAKQFVARAAGGFTFYTKSDKSVGAVLGANSGSWTSFSDVNAKTGFDLPDPLYVLERLSAVPIQTWRYKGEDESIIHMGPTAQDFYGAFGLGNDDRQIVTVDADGVTMAAIQGLYELVREQQALIAGQQAEIERMQTVLEKGGARFSQ